MLNLPAHTAALAVKFYQGDMFPPAYAKDTMYIAEVRLRSHHQTVFTIESSSPTPLLAAWFLES
jgi:glucose/arabinose dehydrogenase